VCFFGGVLLALLHKKNTTFIMFPTSALFSHPMCFYNLGQEFDDVYNLTRNLIMCISNNLNHIVQNVLMYFLQPKVGLKYLTGKDTVGKVY